MMGRRGQGPFSVLVSLLALALLFVGTARADPAIIGTADTNVSSDSAQFTYVGAWASDTQMGFYQAYSNSSDARVTFSFVGVAAKYIAYKKRDRGICLISLDGGARTDTLDLYDDSGVEQLQTVLWSSGTLAYGRHNVTLFQSGVDPRFGFYPYLLTELWTQVVPTNVAAYTATQTAVFPTSTSKNNSSSSNVAPIAGGVVGGVVAVAVAVVIAFLVRKDRKNRPKRAKPEKVKRYEGKMTIDEDDDPPLNQEHRRGSSAAGSSSAGHYLSGLSSYGHGSGNGTYSSYGGGDPIPNRYPSNAVYGAVPPGSGPIVPQGMPAAHHDDPYGGMELDGPSPYPRTAASPPAGSPYQVRGQAPAGNGYYTNGAVYQEQYLDERGERRSYPVPEF